MSVVRKLPLLMGCLSAIITGIAGYVAGTDDRTNYLRMAVMMAVFFTIGIYIRNSLQSISKETGKKMIQKESRITGQNIDLKSESSGEDFEPLVLNRIISTKIKE